MLDFRNVCRVRKSGSDVIWNCSDPCTCAGLVNGHAMQLVDIACWACRQSVHGGLAHSQSLVDSFHCA